jgi:transcriptional regulator with XRE-family HTH domain
MLHIGERITQLRKQHHLSQEELAKRAQVSRTIIGNYERNTKRIEDIENLSEENKNFVLKMIDMAIQNFKTKQAFG